jgi:hypothetical protein
MLHRNAVRAATTVALLAAATACVDTTASNGLLDITAMGAAFNVVPAAFTNVESSFMGGTATEGFIGDAAGDMRRGGGGHGPGGGGHGRGRGPGGPGFGGLMGGGAFHGLEGLVGGGRPRPIDLTGCTASGARVTCPDETRGGLTIARSFAFATVTGTAQAAPDATTNSVNAKQTVTGTMTRHNGEVSTVNHTSDRTVTGLAEGSTQRTINATSSGTETTTFENRDGVTVTLAHSANDAVTNVIVPVTNGTPSYPTAGKVERNMTVTITRDGAAPETLTRSEVLTYDGSATAKLVITVNGTSKTCSLPLPHGRPTCE